MNVINQITEILGDRAPAQLDYATETTDGVEIPINPKKKRHPLTGHSSEWNQFFAERNLHSALAPLVEKGWTVAPGPVSRKGRAAVLILRPPATDHVDTATLPLKDRVLVDGQRRRRKGDVVDDMAVNEQTREVTFDSTDLSGHGQRVIAEVVDNLRNAGWTGPIASRFGQSGIYGTLTAPVEGLQVKQARVDALLSPPAKTRTLPIGPSLASLPKVTRRPA